MSAIAWPAPDGKKPSTTEFGKNVWCDLLAPFDTPASNSLINSIRAEKNWRKNYIKYVHACSEIMASCSSHPTVLASCSAGLNAMSENMLCGSTSVRDAVVTNNKPSTASDFTTTTIANKNNSTVSALSIPHPTTTASLSSSSLQAQVDHWASYGCIESGVASSITAAITNPTTNLSIDNKIFVLLGATSALGPYKTLESLGATIACISRNGPKLDALVSNATNSNSTLLLPTSPEGKTGADLLSDAPAIARWIASLDPSKTLVLTNLVYLDGEKNVRASTAIDAVTEYVLAQRKNVALTYLVSPATSHVRSTTSVALSIKNYNAAPFWQSAMGILTGLKFNDSKTLGTGLSVVNGLSGVQGPNYALAKTSQQWRAMVARSAGFTVSANHAPACRTENMISHATIAAALNGMQSFAPLVAFKPATASGLMAGLMLYDINNADSRANCKNKEKFHPMELFVDSAAHGGVWGCAYNTDSIGTSSFLLGKLKGEFTPPESVAE